MTLWTFVLSNLRFHARSHIGVALGAAVGSAALVGALLVGDSVRGSLRDMALARLGRADAALAGNDRLFRAQLAADMAQESRGSNASPEVVSVLQLPGIASAGDGSARANRVQILGVDEGFWKMANQPPGIGELPPDAVVLNSALAEQLHAHAGDAIILRVQKPSLLSRDAPISPQNDTSVALRLKVTRIVTDEEFGRFGLQANQVAPFNAFVNLQQLQKSIAQPGRANLILYSGGHEQSASDAANKNLLAHWQLADAELQLRELPEGGVELRSSRVFLDPAVVKTARAMVPDAQPVITYLVNEIDSPPFSTPYSMVTAIDAPIVPPDMRDNEILLNDWLAADLQAKAGDDISLTYFVLGDNHALAEKTQTFKVHGTVPLAGAAADRGLMPDFPGIAEAESSSDWDAGFPIQFNKIRPKDEQYWKEHRGTPKAFITLAAGEQIWTNRFGDFTALRFPASAGTLQKINDALREKISPANFGLAFQPVREQALAASSQATDFGGLFIGFSLFLIVAALLLMTLLFQFSLEQRATEIGILLALGFRPAQVRRIFLCEGAALAAIGGVAGTLGGILYARIMLLGLSTIWRGAVGTSALRFHASAESLLFGAVAGILVALFTIWIALRKQGRQPARELLAEGFVEKYSQTRGGWKQRRGLLLGVACIAAALGLARTAKSDASSAETFFCAGALLLIAGWGFCSSWLWTAGMKERFTVAGLGLRNCGRRRKRSLAAISLLASGIFLILAIGVFRIDANSDANLLSSGTGGFALIGESSIPLTHDLNSAAGRDFYNLNYPSLKNVRAFAFRVHDGDEASCLNLNRAQQPRLLGVNAREFQTRNAFTFTQVADASARANPWMLLTKPAIDSTNFSDEIPAVADENSILWAMGKKIGDTVDYTDAKGRPFKARLVGALENSVLQGSLIIDERQFMERFPDEGGYRMFLFDAPSNSVAEAQSLLTQSLQDFGMEITPAAQRLNAFNTVQNTYLSTFQVLGGLGLLLGSAGLGIVVLRNVQERRGELALMLALGFRRGALQWLALSEHFALLTLGLCVGAASAAMAVLPTVLSSAGRIPYMSLGLTCAAVLLNGVAWVWLATRFALRGRLLDALRSE